jgi:undecaprenyl-diphosphatase
MDYLSIIILGIVQGITEFLPISSDGHLVLVGEILRRWRGLRPDQLNAIPVIVALHIGTLMSILLVLRQRVFDLLKNPKLMAAVVVATIPVVVIGKPLKDALESLEQTIYFPLLAGIGLCITAVIMFLCGKVESGSAPLEQFGERPRGWWDALVVGMLQCIAPLPGVSRSGSTIFAGLWRGYSREAAAQFSFLIAIPAIAGAVVLHLPDMAKADLGTPIPVLIAGIVVSFVVGVLALNWLLKIVTSNRLHYFAWYCLVVGIVVIGWQMDEIRRVKNSPSGTGESAIVTAQ